MRQGRTQSRSATRNASSSPSGNLNTTLVKKSMKLPQIAGVPDEIGSSSGNGQQSSGLVVGVCSQQGKRPYQEDEYSIRPFVNEAAPPGSDPNVETHFFGLFDGHAGGRCSNYVAGSLHNVLAEDSSFFSNLPQALKRSFHQTNESFLKVAEKMKYHDGSTGITAVVRDSKVLVANVGDCRCLIISGGRPIQMSIDQKPTNPEEQKRIVALGGTVVYCMGVARVNRVLAVSRAFGNRTLRTVIRPDAEMMQRELTMDDDYLVMASDGLWDVLKNKDVCDMCYSPFTQNNPQIIADELVQSALMRGSMDNVTCIVVRLTDYVQRLFGSRGGAGASSALPSAGAGAGQHNGQQTLFSSTSGGGNNDRQVGTLERASSLRNVPQDNNSNNSCNNGATSQGSGGLLPLSRQYSTGSISTANRAESQPPALQLAPVLDNYLYSPGNSNNRNRTASGGESPGFQLPSAGGPGGQGGRVSPAQQGIASLRQHMHRDGSFNFEDDEQTVAMPGYNSSGLNSANTSGSGASWGTSQPAMASSPVGPGSTGFGQASSGGYASRRPNTMGGAAGNVLGGTRASFTSAMPNLISMFNQSAPQAGASGGNNSLLPLSSSSSPMAGAGAGAGMWSAEGDYSGSSGLTDSTAGSRVATSHGAGGGYSQQRAGPLGTIFPINYKKPPSKK